MGMQALPLIQFLLQPKRNRIHALNSPFNQDTFKLTMAEALVRRGKADIMDGVLVFEERFGGVLHQQQMRLEMDRSADAAFDRTVALERSGGQSDRVQLKWAQRSSGRRGMEGAPQCRTFQVVRWGWPSK